MPVLPAALIPPLCPATVSASLPCLRPSSTALLLTSALSRRWPVTGQRGEVDEAEGLEECGDSRDAGRTAPWQEHVCRTRYGGEDRMSTRVGLMVLR